MKTISVALVALALFAASGVRAQDCVPVPPESEMSVGGLYVDNDLCQLDCVASVWIYQESNGIDGLQRNDAGADDTCGGVIAADTLLASVHQ